ncbi:MAG: dethiobiotin synthase [Myxococcales bacterium]|nr:MAG: dethiobiotin synthase [Myxococcales bacterium]
MTRRARGLFVSATYTGVGKTLVACELIRRLRSRGIDACGMKPVETGVSEDGPLDALALHAASGGGDPLEDVCPQRFALPAAPIVAAEAEQRCVDLKALQDAFRRLSARHECVIVEGAGGLSVPLTPALDMAGLAAELGLPVLVVARARLGTINHTLLTLDALRAHALRPAGVIVSRGEGVLSAADEHNLAYLRATLADLWLGDIPFLEKGAGIPERALDLERILRGLGLEA